MNEEFISVLNYLTAFILFLLNGYVDEVIIMDTNQGIKGLALEFGEFLHLIWIWLLTTEKPVTNWTEYFSETPIDIFGGCSICVNQFMSGNQFEIICSTLKFTAPPPPSLSR